MKQILNAALLVMDMQTPIVKMVPEEEQFLNKVSQAIAIARERKIPVIYVRVGFRPGSPEISPNNKTFAASRERFAQMGEQWMEFHPAIAPTADDVSITKRRVSAFTGSDLEVVLRGLQIQHIILTGIATSGVILSTLREAADKDYQITVLADCCADRDEEVHRVLTTKIFPTQADVISMKEWR